jgi:hypothetical protein
VRQADAKDEAEIWLLAQSDGGTPVRYPPSPLSTYSIPTGGNWNINGDLVLEFDGCCNLTIYEQDRKINIDRTDFLGCARFTSGADPSNQKIAANGTDKGNGDYTEFTIEFSWAQ